MSTENVTEVEKRPVKSVLSKKALTKLTLLTTVLVAGIFGYFYWLKLNPVDTIKSIPVGAVTNPPTYAYHIFGSPELPIKKILGITIDNNKVYAADSDAGMVFVFDMNGQLLSSFGKKSKVQMRNPYGIAVYNGNVYVGDGGLGKILIFDTDGNYQGEFKTQKPVNIPSQLVIKNDKLYFADLGTKQVFVYDMQGKLLLSFGKKGDNPGEFQFPHGIAVDDKENIYIADSGNNRVAIHDKTGKFVKYLGENGQTFSIGTPRGLSFDSRGNLYVVAGIENMVYAFDKDLKHMFTFNKLEADTTLGLPSGLAISGNFIMVSETESSRIAVYKY